jgi:hypothetical protein
MNNTCYMDVPVLLAGTSSGKVGPFITDVVQVSRRQERACLQAAARQELDHNCRSAKCCSA